jgi:uncharacterized protein YacL
MNLPRSIDPLLAIIRLVLVAAGGFVGYTTANSIQGISLVNTVYTVVLGVLLAYLITGRISRWIRQRVAAISDYFLNLTSQAVFAATLAVIVALLISVLVNQTLANVPGFSERWYWSVLLTLMMVAFFVTVGVSNQRIFSVFTASETRERNSEREARKTVAGPMPKMLDSNILIDGRILEIAQTGFIEGQIIVPGFVLRELQQLSDQSDPAKRAKGRRGFEVMEKLKANPLIEVSVREYPDGGSSTTDERLWRAAQVGGAALVTNDSGLGRIAALSGVRVLNLNELADALKTRYGTGDELVLKIEREGQRPGQGAGNLEDGTLVVIEDGAAFIKRLVRVTVVGINQTSLGRMIFCRIKDMLD